MQSQKCCKLFLLLMLLSTVINLIQGRGGGGGRRGGGLLSWRKGKKSALSVSSSRRQSSGGQISGTLGNSNFGNKPLKPQPQNKPQTPSYPRQQLPNGATYYPSGSNLPQGATYHPLSYYSSGTFNGGAIPSGGIFYPNAAALPQNAVLYSQSSKSTFSPGNFLFGMYAGHMLRQGLFGHHTPLLPFNHGNDNNHQQQQRYNNDDKIVIINNGAATNVPDVIPANEFSHYSDEELALDTLILNNSTEEQNSSVVKDTTDLAQSSTEYGIICFPLTVNETSEQEDDENVRQVEKIVCYPAPEPVSLSSPAPLIPQSEASSGIICVPRKEIETNLTDSSQTTVTYNQDCYPAPPTSTWTEESLSTKSPESVIGNIPNDEETMTKQQETVVTTHQTQTVLKALQEEEEKAMRDFVQQFKHDTLKEEFYFGDDEHILFSASQCYRLQIVYAILLPFVVLLSTELRNGRIV